MSFNFEGFVYLLAGSAVMFLYMKRKKELSLFNHDVVPELDKKTFDELKTLLWTSYQRTFYIAVAFLYLAFVTLANRSSNAKVFGFVVTVTLFVYNIPPRNKVMKILVASGIDPEVIKKRGMKL